MRCKEKIGIHTLERMYYKSHIRSSTYLKKHSVPLFKRFKLLSKGGELKFWGYDMYSPSPHCVLFTYGRSGSAAGLSRDWIEVNTKEFMLMLPDNELPRYAVRDGLPQAVKDVLVGRLDGRIRGIEQRQDLVDLYLRMDRRLFRLYRVGYLLCNLLANRIRGKV